MAGFRGTKRKLTSFGVPLFQVFGCHFLSVAKGHAENNQVVMGVTCVGMTRVICHNHATGNMIKIIVVDRYPRPPLGRFLFPCVFARAASLKSNHQKKGTFPPGHLEGLDYVLNICASLGLQRGGSHKALVCGLGSHIMLTLAASQYV